MSSFHNQTIFVFFILLLLVTIGIGIAAPVPTVTSTDPVVYLDLNEGSGLYALDASGHGSGGSVHGATRIENGGCGNALFLSGNSYVEIPYSPRNHPTDAITVSLWFYIESATPQTLISAYSDGGYRISFDDGNDLWWTITADGRGDISVPVKHEGISPREWHHVTGSYDGTTSKIYLDGVLRNQVNATGKIRYGLNTPILIGASPGSSVSPDPSCPSYFQGGIDEVRIYDRALNYGEVMDDRFSRPSEPGILRTVAQPLAFVGINTACAAPSSSITLANGETVTTRLIFANASENGTRRVLIPRGSKITVKAFDLYSTTYADSWYVELADENGRITRSIMFPNTNNAPVEGIIPSGNATVIVRYFDGPARFPASIDLQIGTATISAPPITPKTIFENPIIVIYSASWATLIAIVVVIFWLHKRRKKPECVTVS